MTLYGCTTMSLAARMPSLSDPLSHSKAARELSLMID